MIGIFPSVFCSLEFCICYSCLLVMLHLAHFIHSTTPTMLASRWASVLAAHGPLRVEIGGLLLVQLLAFWLPSAVYIALPWLAPALSARHKLQPAPRQPTAADIWHCAAVVLRNNVLSTALSVGLALAAAGTHSSDTSHSSHGSSPPGRLPPGLRVEASLPAAAEVVRHLLLCCAMREVLFYYAHRLLHQPRVYRAVHKTHHKFIAPVALAAQYAHPVEHIVANVLPVGLPPLLLHAHVLTYWAFVALMLVETATVHSGYDFFDGAARMHDAHHEKFNLNYGVFGWMDWMHGTDGKGKAETEANKA